VKKIIILIIGLYCSVSLFGQTQNENLKISHLSGDFYVFTTFRTFKGKPISSNGMYLVTEKGVVMVDTPWDTTQFQPLLDSIEIKHKKKVVLCIATHSHEDRTGGSNFSNKKVLRPTLQSKLMKSVKNVVKKEPSFIS
jgi:metallo-beta-lactamase class B